MTATMTNTEALVAKYAERIINGEEFNKQEEQGAGFAQALSAKLMEAGFGHYDTGSRCKVASAEFHLIKRSPDVRKYPTILVEITSSFFLGVFTIIHARHQK